ncbi:protein shortage in chiasmata 1 ortholog isoform X2 [Hemicordylus capensis]|uniref:protein shortage in chiasmata 1 ortholog isoform X2 n=1 Tax=Hemicordylus capensis TaxID=884348 RepID=UPI0023046F3C|nr:protein shortage in chiasmata 1 ortholog isoform X2 [Hemicordylus capensis]
MFAALKYHAVDYLYEKVSQQRFFFERLSIHIPSCLYKDKNYYHDGDFADDKYRRPWTRVSVDSIQIVMNFSVLDLWKEYFYIEDFLEKKPISSIPINIHNEDIEVVPSSNPCSQCEPEDAYLLIKDDSKQEFSDASHLQLNYVPVILKEQEEEDLYIEDELVFTDHLTQYAKLLPNLRTLLSRLSIFRVQDPLLSSSGNSITEEDIFRECFTFKRSVASQVKRTALYEDVCKVTLSEEETLVLPLELQSYKTSDLRLNPEIPTCLALKSLLQVAPEVIADESGSYKITSEDLAVKITPEIEISAYCSTQEVCSSQNESELEFSELPSYTSFHARELEVPLTPPCSSGKVHVNSLYATLQSEPVSPLSKSFFITESTKVHLEGLLWQSEKYQNTMSSLLLAELQTSVPTCQQLLVTELKKLFSIHEDKSEFSTVEEDGWINLRENMAFPCILETLSTDLGDGDSFISTNVEQFSKIATFHLQRWLEEKNSIAKNKVVSVGALDCGGTKDPCWSPQKKETFLPLPLGHSSGVHLHDENIEKQVTKDKLLHSETETPLHFGKHKDQENYQLKPSICKKVSVEPNSTLGDKKMISFEQPRKCGDDFDLLSNFIMLRSKHMITQSEETNSVDIQEEVPVAKEESPAFETHDNPVVPHPAVPMETKENEEIVSIQIKASENQFEAYHILEATAAPVLKELLSLGMHNWRFATLNFDDTRFFLKQQEKVISDTFKQGVTGTEDARDITVFKHAAILHLLVTVRDLLLTCSLNTALGYLCKAKYRYKDFLGSSMDNIWRQLKIVQFAQQKEHKATPKITKLQFKMLKWVQSNTDEQNKVVIVTRMDFDDEMDALIKTINTVPGLKAVYLDSEKKGALLDSKNIISSLEKCSCVIVHNQHIGPDFPWTHFSLVVEYNYSENSCWFDICKSLNISYITFVTALPETVEIEEVSPGNFGCVLLGVQIPYIFLTSEGLLNMPEILQLLESKYNITFIERSCCEALQLFGSTDRYVVVTVDECTVIVMQNIEELNYEKSSDNIVLRLMVLSLQYSCCWIIFYSRERLNSQYILAGKTLHHLALIYAALVPFAQKSEDFEVKVALTPGVEETALFIRQVADYSLMTSKRDPQEWLDKSWLAVLPSEAEKCLLTFPCINPLVAQVMLKKSSSLEWLLSTTFDKLQELLPEVPERILKHFSNITSMYTLNPSTESKPSEETVPLHTNMNTATSFCSQVPFSEVLLSSSQEHSPHDQYSRCFNKEEYSMPCSPSYYQHESHAPLKPNARRILMASPVSYQADACSFQERDHNTEIEGQHCLPFLKHLETERRASSSLPTLNNLGESTLSNFVTKMPPLGYNEGDTNFYLENCPQNGTCLSKVTRGPKLDVPVLMMNPTYIDKQILHGVEKHPPVKQCNSSQDSTYSWYLVSNREDFPFLDSFLGEFGRTAYGRTAYSSPEFQFEERFWDDKPCTQKMALSPSFYKEGSNPDRLFRIAGEYKRPNFLSSNQREQNVSAAGLEFTQIPQLKKRRLTFEKDPGRSDGQTRLKFF